MADVGKTPWLKFFVCADPADLCELEREAEAFGTAACSHHFYSEANYHEFVAKGVSKGSMFEAIRQMPEFSQTKIIALGDYLNDRELLEAADIGIAINSGAAIAREIADVTIKADSLEELVFLKTVANALQHRVSANYRFVLSFNSTLILLGALGILQPAASAMLHNLSTLGISLKSMTNLVQTPSSVPQIAK